MRNQHVRVRCWVKWVYTCGMYMVQTGDAHHLKFPMLQKHTKLHHMTYFCARNKRCNMSRKNGLPMGWFISLLVGGKTTPVKNMISSAGITIPNIWKIIKIMFQTNNQITIIFPLLLVYTLWKPPINITITINQYIIPLSHHIILLHHITSLHITWKIT